MYIYICTCLKKELYTLRVLCKCMDQWGRHSTNLRTQTHRISQISCHLVTLKLDASKVQCRIEHHAQSVQFLLSINLSIYLAIYLSSYLSIYLQLSLSLCLIIHHIYIYPKETVFIAFIITFTHMSTAPYYVLERKCPGIKLLCMSCGKPINLITNPGQHAAVHCTFGISISSGPRASCDFECIYVGKKTQIPLICRL